MVASKEWFKAYRDRLFKQGKCKFCGHKRDRPKHVLCSLCAEIQASKKRLVLVTANILKLEEEERQLDAHIKSLEAERAARKEDRKLARKSQRPTPVMVKRRKTVSSRKPAKEHPWRTPPW